MFILLKTPLSSFIRNHHVCGEKQRKAAMQVFLSTVTLCPFLRLASLWVALTVLLCPQGDQCMLGDRTAAELAINM